MLYILKGRAGSGKTARMRQILAEKLNTSNSRPLLLVPEQFSFETERTMLKQLGAKKLKDIDILTFSRLSHNILKNLPLYQRNIPDNGVRIAMMSEALLQLEGRLSVFENFHINATSLRPLVELCKEFKHCKINSDILLQKAALLDDGLLKEKLQEINIINEAYDALIKQSYFDDTDALDLLCDYTIKNNFFADKTIFIDGFRSFSKQEFEVLGVMLSQADDVYITICSDEFPGKYTPFYYTKNFENRIRTIASKNNVVVNDAFYKQSEDAYPKDIFILEKNLYSEKDYFLTESDGSITVAECVDKDDECRYVASSIKRILRSGNYRCRDIAVIERVGGSYKNDIVDELKRLSIPVFEDSRHSLKYETLFIYLNAVLLCLTQSFNTENVLTYLKTGLSSLSFAEISRLEKYALVWGVGTTQWTNGFEMHPDGFGKALDEKAKNKLEELNKSREKAIAPILKLKKECCDKTGKEITENIYNFLVGQDIQSKLFDLYKQLNDDGFPVEANRQEVSWNEMMNILDSMAILGNEKYISLSRWYELFKILVDSGEVGEIPQGLDEVIIGSADRIRTEKKKIVFLVGVNKDEFPLVSVRNGILTDSDRVSLTNLGLEIDPPFKDTVDEERFISYCAVTAASEKLFLSYKTVDSVGEELFPSEIIDVAKNSITDLDFVRTRDMDPMELIESEDGAFSLLAENYSENTSLRSTLFEYFSDKQEFIEKINSIENVLGDKKYKFVNDNISKDLFKKDMYLSASRVESFYKCPFAYFIRYGMKAEPLRVAELDPAQGGNVVHFVMENLLKKYPKGQFISADDGELKEFVEKILNEYIEEMMGGVKGKSSRFLFLYNHLVETCMAIINRLKNEFSAGAFEPCGFEVAIGGEDIPPYEIELSEGKASIHGYIDRVDMMEKDGIKYIRIIDYKTGTKEFKLAEIFDGLNIQMILYLMSLEKNGKNVYGEFIPSGVLYLPSKIGISKYLKERNPQLEDVEHQKKISGQLSGMVLESLVVLNGMGAVDNPYYFPVGYDSIKEKFTGNTYTQKNFRSISKIIDEKIRKMGDSLHKGEVYAIPCGSKGEGIMCKYCSYKSVCGYEYGDEVREISNFNHNTALQMLGGDDDE